MNVGISSNMKKPNARKLLSHCLALLDVTQKTSVYIMGYARTKLRTIHTGSYLWSSIHNHIVHTKINAILKQALYN